MDRSKNCDEILKLVREDESLTFAEIARRTGVTRERVRQCAAEVGIDGRSRQRLQAQAFLERVQGEKCARLQVILDEFERTGICPDGQGAARLLNQVLAGICKTICCVCRRAVPLTDVSSKTTHRCKKCSAVVQKMRRDNWKKDDPEGYRRFVRYHNLTTRERKKRRYGIHDQL